ncbi:hypothetical protein ACFE04_009355 [Oxalis oulophora]
MDPSPYGARAISQVNTVSFYTTHYNTAPPLPSPSPSASGGLRSENREGTAKAIVADHISQTAQLLKLSKNLLDKIDGIIENEAEWIIGCVGSIFFFEIKNPNFLEKKNPNFSIKLFETDGIIENEAEF